MSSLLTAHRAFFILANMNGYSAVSVKPAQLSGYAAQPSRPAQAENNDQLQFQNLLTVMMMASSLSALNTEESGSSQQMMLPLMMMLMDQLMRATLEQATETVPSTDPSPQLYAAQPSGRPVGGVLTQRYHAGHNGLDFGIPLNTPVQTTMSGKVVYAGWNNQGYGNLVIVENGPYRTYYAHLNSINVQVGDLVNAGGIIGLSGSTGNSTGPHLHYEIRYQMVPIDPTPMTLNAT